MQPRKSCSTIGMQMDASDFDISSGDKTLEQKLGQLQGRERELCSRRRMLTDQDVKDFADQCRLLAQNCETDMQTMAVIGRLQGFLTREEVARALATKRVPHSPGEPTIVERHVDGLLVRWRTAKEDEAESNFFHYELQYGFRFLGGWQAVHIVGRTQFRITSLRPSTTYLVRVRVLNSLGWSAFSPIGSVTTLKAKPTPPPPGTEPKSGGVLGFLGSIPDAYNELVCSIIRPPKAEYDMLELGAKRFRIKRNIYTRRDFNFRNSRNLTLQCSHWEPDADQRKTKQMPVVIYLHGNCGCRVDAIECLEGVLGAGMTLIGIDLSGSGKSEGEFITLGWNERQDTWDLIKYLKATGTVSDVFLWGRSMGAVTALLLAAQPEAAKSVTAIVLDSPFSDLWVLAIELVKSQNLNIPSIATSVAHVLIRNSVKSYTKVDIENLAPVKVVCNARVPALFCAARGDGFVKPFHSERLHKAYGGPKEFQLIEGDHNSARPVSFLAKATKFMQDQLGRQRQPGHLVYPSAAANDVAKAIASEVLPQNTPTTNATNATAAASKEALISAATSAAESSATANAAGRGGAHDVFKVHRVKDMFQSHSERQYAKGMDINDQIKAGVTKEASASSSSSASARS